MFRNFFFLTKSYLFGNQYLLFTSFTSLSTVLYNEKCSQKWFHEHRKVLKHLTLVVFTLLPKESRLIELCAVSRKGRRWRVGGMCIIIDSFAQVTEITHDSSPGVFSVSFLWLVG